MTQKSTSAESEATQQAHTYSYYLRSYSLCPSIKSKPLNLSWSVTNLFIIMTRLVLYFSY
jgi:hypothetical protein